MNDFIKELLEILDTKTREFRQRKDKNWKCNETFHHCAGVIEGLDLSKLEIIKLLKNNKG